MDLNDIEQQLAKQFSSKWITHAYKCGDSAVRVSFGQNHKGLPTYRYWLEETRVDRKAFLTLTCTNRDCPRHQEIVNRWKERTRKLPTKKENKESTPLFASFAEDVQTEYEGQTVFARQAKLVTTVTCPNMAHSPMRATVQGWDLFSSEGLFIATVQKISATNMDKAHSSKYRYHHQSKYQRQQ